MMRAFPHAVAILTSQGPRARLSDEPIEFAAGLAYERAGDLLHVSYGVQDREAWFASFDAESVRRALVAVP